MELLGQNEIDHHQRQVAILSQDSFYRVLTPEQKAMALKGQFNFDHPGVSVVISFVTCRVRVINDVSCWETSAVSSERPFQLLICRG